MIMYIAPSGTLIDTSFSPTTAMVSARTCSFPAPAFQEVHGFFPVCPKKPCKGFRSEVVRFNGSSHVCSRSLWPFSYPRNYCFLLFSSKAPQTCRVFRRQGGYSIPLLPMKQWMLFYWPRSRLKRLPQRRGRNRHPGQPTCRRNRQNGSAADRSGREDRRRDWTSVLAARYFSGRRRSLRPERAVSIQPRL